MGDENIRTLLLPKINALSRHFHLSYLPRAPVHVFSDTQTFYSAAENKEDEASSVKH